MKGEKINFTIQCNCECLEEKEILNKNKCINIAIRCYCVRSPPYYTHIPAQLEQVAKTRSHQQQSKLSRLAFLTVTLSMHYYHNFAHFLRYFVCLHHLHPPLSLCYYICFAQMHFLNLF